MKLIFSRVPKLIGSSKLKKTFRIRLGGGLSSVLNELNLLSI